jgi:hypothetical protein
MLKSVLEFGLVLGLGRDKVEVMIRDSVLAKAKV